MKKLFFLSGLLFFLHHSLSSQEILVFKGTVKCFISDDERSTKGAKNVIVVPGFIPKKSGLTGAQGYYELNTSTAFKLLEDKYVLIYYVSACKECTSEASVFVSSDQARKNREGTLWYITVPTIKMNAGCKKTELQPRASDSAFNRCVSLPAKDLNEVSSLNVITAAPGFLNFLTNIVTAAVAVNSGKFFVDDSASINRANPDRYGKFLFASPMVLTGNTGFNFSSSRDHSESVFWNPAVLANLSNNSGIYVFTNLKNNFKFSGFSRINDRITIGAGGIYTMQEEFRNTVFRFLPDTISHLRKLKEYAFFLAPSFKLSDKLSAGFAVKSIWQNFNLPNSVTITQDPNVNVFHDSTIKRQRFDADISLSYAILPSLRAGINVMNILGSELYADAFTFTQPNKPVRNLRSLGLGFTYRWKQFNFGTDALLTEDSLYEISLGANYVPFNNALLSAGFAFKQKSYSASFKWKQFKISYVDDNDLMRSEKHPGKSKFLDGRIYSGVVFDL